MNTCSHCGQPINVCPYNGDCGEMEAIYRAHQRAVSKDLEPDAGTCTFCACKLADPTERWGVCPSCELEGRMDDFLYPDD